MAADCTAAAVQCGLQVSLPTGAQQCPDSTIGAACSEMKVDPAKASAAVISTPSGQGPCIGQPGHDLPGAAACTVVTLAPSSSAAASTDPITPKNAASSPRPVASIARINLDSSATDARPNQKVELTATAAQSMSGTGSDIEIFDLTTGSVVAACAAGGQCIVDFATQSGSHEFAAYITKPTRRIATDSHEIGSTHIRVRWSGVSLTSPNVVVGPGNPANLSARTDLAVGGGKLLQIYDADTGNRLAFCTHGNACNVQIAQVNAGSRRIVAALAQPSTMLTADAQEQSDPLTVTWLGVTVTASAGYQIGSSITVTAIANADLTNTPWSLGIFDQQGNMVGKPCKSGTTCTAVVTSTSDGAFSARIGAAAAPASVSMLGRLLHAWSAPVGLTNIQATSGVAKPLRLLWGVDSCKAFTDDPSGGTGLYPQITGILGTPDFWGRYLTNTVCPGISAAEVQAAHNKHMAILPIYNDYNCSNVAGYDTGRQYASEAISAAHNLGIPQGRGLAIDIEPPGDACPGAANVDTGFIHGWYDGVKAAGYAPIFYGDGTSGSAFATQWCYAVDALPYIGQTSYLWSFQPSLYGGWVKANAPGYSPNLTGCLGFVHAWQYQLGSMSAVQDVDGDEATSELPLWYP